jgi:Ca2+-binding EF-hand superfamily protein
MQVLADERMKEVSLLEQRELGEVWHSDKSSSRKGAKSPKPQTPKTPAASFATDSLGSADGSAAAGGGGDGGGGEVEVEEELVPYTGPRAAEMEKIRDAFLKADDDGSGALDKLEVRTLITELGFKNITDHYLEGVWGIFDLDGDGVLDLEEVQEMVEVLQGEKGDFGGDENDEDLSDDY